MILCLPLILIILLLVLTGFNSGIVVYDGNKMAKELMYQHNMTDEEAWEYLEYNVFGAYVGEKTPIYILD